MIGFGQCNIFLCAGYYSTLYLVLADIHLFEFKDGKSTKTLNGKLMKGSTLRLKYSTKHK